MNKYDRLLEEMKRIRDYANTYDLATVGQMAQLAIREYEQAVKQEAEEK